MTVISWLGVAALLAPLGAGPSPAADEYAQLVFHSRVVIRVQAAPAPPPPAPMHEKKGPKCVAMSDILGAAVLQPKSVDIVLRGGARVRARFAASCPGLDYYSGFYIAPPPDAKICGGRDVVRDRAGGECAIDRFRTLVPPKAPGRP